MEVIKEIELQLDEKFRKRQLRKTFSNFVKSKSIAKENFHSMLDKLPPIYFYIPESDWPEGEMPESADTYWQGFGRGIYCWVLQTYLHLKADNFPCELIGKMPAEGIVLAHRDSLPDSLNKPGPKLLIICLQAERDPHPYTQLQVVQNPRLLHIQSKLLWQNYFIPLWRQPGLIPRDAARGDRFENIAYFGHERNLAPELKEPSWHKQLEELGLRFEIVDRLRWNDFRNVDATLAVRTFDDKDYTSKPATKLYNSWHAGVPAILGCETSFQSERQSELDYIEIKSLNDALAALKRLRDDKTFRNAMVENGWRRAEKTKPEQLVKQWRSLITDVAVPAYERWCNSSNWSRQSLFQRQVISLKIIRMQKRTEKLAEQILAIKKER